MTRSDETIEVLRATHDGDDLAPRDLYLVQLAVNGDLSADGEVAWSALVEKVRVGYVKPWHFDVENLTKDHEGYVYWRGVNVEHYSHRDADAERAAAKELGAACRFVEIHGGVVDGATVSAALERMRVASATVRRGEQSKNEIMRAFAPNGSNGLADTIWSVLIRCGERRLAEALTTATNAMRASQIEEEPIVETLRKASVYLDVSPTLYFGAGDDADALRAIANRIEGAVK